MPAKKGAKGKKEEAAKDESLEQPVEGIDGEVSQEPAPEENAEAGGETNPDAAGEANLEDPVSESETGTETSGESGAEGGASENNDSPEMGSVSDDENLSEESLNQAISGEVTHVEVTNNGCGQVIICNKGFSLKLAAGETKNIAPEQFDIIADAVEAKGGVVAVAVEAE